MAKKGFNETQTRFSQEKGTPETKYSEARAEWDNRVGVSTVRAKNWRMIAFSLAGIAALAIGGLIFQSAKAAVTPYIIEIDHTSGAVMKVSPAEANFKIKKKNIEYFLQDVIKKTRAIPKDPIIYAENWNSVYNFLSPDVARKINTMVENDKQAERLQKLEATQVKIKYIGKVNDKDKTYQIRWVEDNFQSDGSLKSSTNMTGFITIDFGKPKDEKTINNNPLGMIITDISWNKEI